MGESKTQNVHKKFNELQNRVRLYIINYTVDNDNPFNIIADKDKVIKDIDITETEYDDAIKVLLEKDGMVINEEKSVDFIYPVSALSTDHHVTLSDGRKFTAMCAIDAIGSAFTFHQDVRVDSKCKVTGEPVFVEIKDGKLHDYAPKSVHALTFPLGDLSNWAGSCWNVMNFFRSSAEFDQYLEDMGLDPTSVIKCDIDLAVKEAKATFEV